MRAHTGGSSTVTVSGTTISDTIQSLVEDFPNLRPKVYGPDGALLRHVIVVLNGEDVRCLQGVLTPVGDNDELQLLLAMAGG